MADVITIDGPAGAGKSTVSRILAKELVFLYLDTGAMYRAVALAARRRFGGLPPNPEEAGRFSRSLDITLLNDADRPKVLLAGEDVTQGIRTPEMDLLSSDISAIPEVRHAMAALQRKIAATSDIVAEGRDMGTVVFPDARHKFFLTASVEIRAERRYRERCSRGEAVSFPEVLAQLRRRDRQDETRLVAPLRPAEDATVIETDRLHLDEVVLKILTILKNV